MFFFVRIDLSASATVVLLLISMRSLVDRQITCIQKSFIAKVTLVGGGVLRQRNVFAQTDEQRIATNAVPILMHFHTVTPQSAGVVSLKLLNKSQIKDKLKTKHFHYQTTIITY